jgi:hypothetical protein
MFKKKFKLVIAFLIAGVLVASGVFASRTHSQSKLKDIPLSAAQNSDLQSADKEIEQVQIQLRSMLGNRQMLVRGFAISAGIKPDDLQRFKVEKNAAGAYHFLEYSEQELKQIAEEQKKLAEQNGR